MLRNLGLRGSILLCTLLQCIVMRASAFSSYKTCNDHSDCYTKGEFCDKSNDCMACAGYDTTDSFDGKKPSWCNAYSSNVTIDNDYILLYDEQASDGNYVSINCPTLDICAETCRLMYSVTKTEAVITLTNTFLVEIPAGCTCETLTFSKVFYPEDEMEYWTSTDANFGTSMTRIEIDQFSSEKLDLYVTSSSSSQNNQYVDCSWQYAIVYNSITLTDSSLLKFETQVDIDGGESPYLCPTFSACVQNCRTGYTVLRASTTSIALTSTFKDTTDCVCEKISFTKDDSWNTWNTAYMFGITIPSGANFATNFWQISPSALKLNINLDAENQISSDCIWKYEVSSVAPVPAPTPTPVPAPVPTPTPSPGNSLFGAGLFGILSAITMMSALIFA